MSSFEVCRLLGAAPAIAQVPVIILTASAQEANVSTGFGSWADDYVTKPFPPREPAGPRRAVPAGTAGTGIRQCPL